MTPDEVTHGHVATALLTRQGRGSIGCVSSARDLDRRKLSEIDRRVRGGSRPSLHENSSFHRDAEGIRATIGSPKEAQKLLAALGLRKKVSAAPERHPSEEGEVSKMVELAATKATKAGAQEQPRRASPEDDGDDDGGGNDDDDTVDLRLNLDGLSSSSTTPRPTSTASRTNLIVKANGSDIGKNEGDAV
uniref:Uncharacterized protein n=1 Tax=Plectus sambesii TaxID=2011161 RepID=A0A914XTC6_9BILA